MLGFFPLSGAPLSSKGTTGSNVIALSISEDILIMLDSASAGGIYTAAISERITVGDARSYLYGISIIEAISSIGSSIAAVGNYAAAVSEYIILADTPTPATTYNISRTENLAVLSYAYVVKGWSDVYDVNVAVWGDVANLNLAPWTNIDDSQASDWVPVNNTKLI